MRYGISPFYTHLYSYVESIWPTYVEKDIDGVDVGYEWITITRNYPFMLVASGDTALHMINEYTWEYSPNTGSGMLHIFAKDVPTTSSYGIQIGDKIIASYMPEVKRFSGSVNLRNDSPAYGYWDESYMSTDADDPTVYFSLKYPEGNKDVAFVRFDDVDAKVDYFGSDISCSCYMPSYNERRTVKYDIFYFEQPNRKDNYGVELYDEKGRLIYNSSNKTGLQAELVTFTRWGKKTVFGEFILYAWTVKGRGTYRIDGNTIQTYFDPKRPPTSSFDVFIVYI